MNKNKYVDILYVLFDALINIRSLGFEVVWLIASRIDHVPHKVDKNDRFHINWHHSVALASEELLSRGPDRL